MGWKSHGRERRKKSVNPKGLNAKNIHKELFHVYGGKFLSRKAVHN
jgi:hypothetical protein